MFYSHFESRDKEETGRRTHEINFCCHLFIRIKCMRLIRNINGSKYVRANGLRIVGLHICRTILYIYLCSLALQIAYRFATAHNGDSLNLHVEIFIEISISISIPSCSHFNFLINNRKQQYWATGTMSMWFSIGYICSRNGINPFGRVWSKRKEKNEIKFFPFIHGTAIRKWHSTYSHSYHHKITCLVLLKVYWKKRVKNEIKQHHIL